MFDFPRYTAEQCRQMRDQASAEIEAIERTLRQGEPTINRDGEPVNDAADQAWEIGQLQREWAHWHGLLLSCIK